MEAGSLISYCHFGHVVTLIVLFIGDSDLFTLSCSAIHSKLDVGSRKIADNYELLIGA